MRVGDEKDPDEADTVGAITLRSEHIKIVGDTLHFDFLGKDSVRWVKEYKAPPQSSKTSSTSKTQPKNTSSKASTAKNVSRFLSEKMPKLTAKVFRTWRCTKTVKEELEKSGVTKEDPDYKKNFAAKMANFKVAEVANHKRKIPPTFDQRVADKEAKLKDMQATAQSQKERRQKNRIPRNPY